jgi:TolB protein
MTKTIVSLSAGLILLAAASSSAPSVAAAGHFRLESTIAFTSTRDFPGASMPLLTAAETYLMNPDGTNLRRVTDNTNGDSFPVLSPDGKKIVFDSNRNRAEDEPLNASDLFVMSTDGSDQMRLTRGSSANWSPDGKHVAFHASASGTGTPIRTDPGSATSDSDIFVANVDDLLAGVEPPRNITNSVGIIDEDADWSPDGKQIVYTRHADGDHPQLSNTAEIYVINADGTGTPQRLTYNSEEERGPAWSPDGTRILYSCRIGATPTTPSTDFEICVINADGTGLVQLTDNDIGDLTATWSPDGHQIAFHKRVGDSPPFTQRLFRMNADGTGVQQLTVPPGFNNLANWGELRVKG